MFKLRPVEESDDGASMNRKATAAQYAAVSKGGQLDVVGEIENDEQLERLNVLAANVGVMKVKNCGDGDRKGESS